MHADLKHRLASHVVCTRQDLDFAMVPPGGARASDSVASDKHLVHGMSHLVEVAADLNHLEKKVKVHASKSFLHDTSLHSRRCLPGERLCQEQGGEGRARNSGVLLLQSESDGTAVHVS